MRALIIRYLYRKIPRHIENDYDAILMHYSYYYRNLNSQLKKRFRLRLFHLLNIVAFSSPHFVKVTREMRAVIGSSIIEITFGLRDYLPRNFRNIVVMPSRYMYPGYGEPFLGHIDYSNRKLYFSWQDVKNGYRDPHDAVNVALHEMAHVLEFEHKYYYIINNFFNKVQWNKWAQVAFKKMHIIRAGDNRYLKDYGGSNMTEMFAVCIEAFFEKPESFKENLPEIYSTMVNLLLQDPTSKTNPLL